MKEAALFAAGIVFLIVSLFHLVRYILKLEGRIGTFVIPLWFSIVGFVFALALSVWMFISLEGLRCV